MHTAHNLIAGIIIMVSIRYHVLSYVYIFILFEN